RVITLRAPEWRSDVVLGNLAFAASTPGIALAHFERALARAERPENFFNAGIARVANGDRDGGITALVVAAELNPAVLRELRDGDLALAVRARLEASGFAGRYPWIFDKTPAATAPPSGRK
ncbi:MAG: hypothetical protein GW878_03965, partial [Acidobacteria bacterium]|nr:hypothetical protein [Acidobacteriota bacterium]